MISISVTDVAKISPNSTPMMSTRTQLINPRTTNPSAKVEWESRLSTESAGSIVRFWINRRDSATKAETKNTTKVVLLLINKESATPRSAACDIVSPKNASLRQTIKQPRGPATIAIPTPATRARIKKSSSNPANGFSTLFL